MSIEITESFRRQYADNFIRLMQQKGSRLESTVQVATGVRAKAKSFDRIGAVTARKRTSRHSDTYNVDTPHSRRWAWLDPYDIGDLVDDPDKIRALLDPTSDYLANFRDSLNRAKDDVIIAALRGSARTGEEDTTTIALPTAQKIAHANAGLTVEKVKEARQKLAEKDADPDIVKYMVVGPQQVTDMLGEIEAISSDYVNFKPLQDGKMVQFMGFTWIESNRLYTASSIRYCLAYIGKAACGLAVGADVTTRVAERADKSFSTQSFGSMDLGAVRIEEEAVIEVACSEA